MDGMCATVDRIDKPRLHIVDMILVFEELRIRLEDFFAVIYFLAL